MATPSTASVERRTWTFFGHWDGSDGLIIDHAVLGEHSDVYPDDGTSPGGLWCAAGIGATLEAAEADARGESLDGEEKVIVATSRAPDGATVAQIDTLEGLGHLRVWLNDGLIYDADPEAG